MHYITSHVILQAICNNKEVRDLTGCHNICAFCHSSFIACFFILTQTNA